MAINMNGASDHEKAIIFLSLALGLFVLFQFARYLFFNAPLRSILAAIKYEEYRQAQGIDARLIQSKRFWLIISQELPLLKSSTKTIQIMCMNIITPCI